MSKSVPPSSFVTLLTLFTAASPERQEEVLREARGMAGENMARKASTARLRPRGCPAGIEPQRWRQVLAARIEHHQLAMERLISALDRMEPDPDLEPSLAAPETHISSAWGWGPDPVRMPGDSTQEHWADGGSLDLEEDAVDDDHADNPVTLNPDRRSRDRRFYRPTKRPQIVPKGASNDA